MQHESNTYEPPHDWVRKNWWAFPAAAVLLFTILTMVFTKQQEPPASGTSYDASDEGYRAAYLLLEELDYPVVRSKRLAGDGVRMILTPHAKLDDAASVGEWVRAGHILILGDRTGEFSRKIGIDSRIRPMQQGGSEEPGVTKVPHGNGEVWLLNPPGLFTNSSLRTSDNAILLCRLADDAKRDRSGSLLFDEYFHGLHDRPGLTELLFRPPALWVSVQGVLLLGLLLWHFAPRFGAIRPVSLPSRRSKEEFLDALAALLDRKRDFAEAFRTVRDGLVRDMEHELGLPAGTPMDRVVGDAARRRHMDRQSLLRVLTADRPPDGAGHHAFLNALNQLETFRDEFFRKQRP